MDIFARDKEVKENVTLAKTAISLTICVLGLLANLVVIAVILLLREHKKSTFHWYVMQLAIADAIFLITIPFQVSEDMNDQWIFPDWLCKAKESILFINYYASILFLTVMSINRYIAVCHPFADSVQRLKKSKFVILIIISIWLVSLFLAIPTMMYSQTVGLNPNCKCTNQFPKIVNFTEKCIMNGKTKPEELRNCTEDLYKQSDDDLCISFEIPADYDYSNYDYPVSDASNSYMPGFDNSSFNLPDSFGPHLNGSDINEPTIPKFTPSTNELLLFPGCSYRGQPITWTAYIIFNFVGMFILPFTALVVFYGLIVAKLVHMSSKTRRNSIRSKQTESRAEQDRRRVTIMCAALVGAFLICWLPFHAIHLAKLVGIFSTTTDICHILPVFGTLMAYLNSALNPYLYTFLGSGIMQKLHLLKEVPEIQALGRLCCGKKLDKDQSSIYQDTSKPKRMETGLQSSREAPTADTNFQLSSSTSPVKSSEIKQEES